MYGIKLKNRKIYKYIDKKRTAFNVEYFYFNDAEMLYYKITKIIINFFFEKSVKNKIIRIYIYLFKY